MTNKENNQTKDKEFTHMHPLSTILVCVAFTNTLYTPLKQKINIPAVTLELKATYNGYFSQCKTTHKKKQEKKTRK